MFGLTYEQILLIIFLGLFLICAIGIIIVLAFAKKKTLKAAGVKLYSREGMGRSK